MASRNYNQFNYNNNRRQIENLELPGTSSSHLITHEEREDKYSWDLGYMPMNVDEVTTENNQCTRCIEKDSINNQFHNRNEELIKDGEGYRKQIAQLEDKLKKKTEENNILSRNLNTNKKDNKEHLAKIKKLEEENKQLHQAIAEKDPSSEPEKDQAILDLNDELNEANQKIVQIEAEGQKDKEEVVKLQSELKDVKTRNFKLNQDLGKKEAVINTMKRGTSNLEEEKNELEKKLQDSEKALLKGKKDKIIKIIIENDVLKKENKKLKEDKTIFNRSRYYFLSQNNGLRQRVAAQRLSIAELKKMCDTVTKGVGDNWIANIEARDQQIRKILDEILAKDKQVFLKSMTGNKRKVRDTTKNIGETEEKMTKKRADGRALCVPCKRVFVNAKGLTQHLTKTHKIPPTSDPIPSTSRGSAH